LPLVGDEPSEQFGVDRLAVRGQARDLSFVLLRLESADVRDISVVIADRIEAAYVVQASKATVLDMVDVRGGIVPGAVHRDHCSLAQSAREIGGACVSIVMIDELNGSCEPPVAT